jgi:hypothetical protein
MWSTRELGASGATRWDCLAGGHFYSTSQWLRYCARDRSGTVGVVTAEVDGGSAAVPVAEVRSEPAAYYRWHELLGTFGLPRPEPQGLLVGPRRGYQTHLLASPHVCRERAAAALVARLLELREQIRGRPPRPAPCVAMYLTTADAVALRQAGVRAAPVLLDADAWMTVPLDGWSGWLDALPQRRRSAVRREARAFRAAGYTIDRMTLLECHAAIAPIWRPNQARYGHPVDLDVLTHKLREQGEAMGSAAKVLICRRPGGEPVGFCVFYQWGDTVFLRIAGFDYPRLCRAAEYFNVVYYAHVESAPRLGVRRLHAGIKSLEAKALRGARLRPLWLMDLSEDSVLIGHERAIYRHNAEHRARLAATSPAVAAAMDDADWSAFASRP